MASARERTSGTVDSRPRRDRLSEEELLARAARLVAGDWCRTSLAEDSDGYTVEPWSPSACRWSPLGALIAVWLEGGAEERETFETAYASLALATGGRLEAWNAATWRTKWHVLRAFARAREFIPEARRQARARALGPQL